MRNLLNRRSRDDEVGQLAGSAVDFDDVAFDLAQVEVWFGVWRNAA
jgi:hypothetical protein